MINTALYARYSSDDQRSASIDDQIRNGRELADRHGLPEPIVYNDEAISGTRLDRPDFQRLLGDLESGSIQVLIVDDLSRLSRAEDMPQLISRIKFFGARVLSVDGFDSDREDAKIQTWIRGLVGNIYLDDLAKKTHRGLKGRALAGHSAGGLAYGYRSSPVYEGKKVVGYKRHVDADEARIINQIFQRYAEGSSPKSIAEWLNSRGIAAPKGGSWAFTAIYGHQKKDTGILNNPMYIGTEIWNRSKWIKDPMTGRRKRLERPKEEWVVHDSPELRIVPQELWNAVKKRQKDTAEKIQSRQTCGAYRGRGRGGKYLLSGVLKCGCCGANFTMVNKTHYGCATRINRGKSVCGNTQLISREQAEHTFLKVIRKDLLSKEAYSFYIAELNRLSKESRPNTQEYEKDFARAEQEITNILDAIRQGIVTSSTKAALEQAERQKAEAEKNIATAKTTVIDLVPQAKDIYRELVKNLGDLSDVKAAQKAVSDLLGEIQLHPTEHGLEAEYENGGLMTAVSRNLVAGAGLTRSARAARLTALVNLLFETSQVQIHPVSGNKKGR